MWEINFSKLNLKNYCHDWDPNPEPPPCRGVALTNWATVDVSISDLISNRCYNTNICICSQSTCFMPVIWAIMHRYYLLLAFTWYSLPPTHTCVCWFSHKSMSISFVYVLDIDINSMSSKCTVIHATNTLLKHQSHRTMRIPQTTKFII